LLLASTLALADTPPVQVDRWSTPPSKADPLLVHRTFHSAAMDLEVGYNIYLPPGYDAADRKKARYPVLYWLHGMGQSEATDHYPIHYLNDAIKAGTIKPMIVVYASGGQRTYYTDNPKINCMPETQIIGELIPHVDQTYRTRAQREGRAIAGMSMGGFGALKFAFKYPEMFSSVTAFAPAIRDAQSFAKDRPDILKRMFKNDPAFYAANHPETLLKRNLEQIKDNLPISIYVGTADYLLAGSRALHQTLTELKLEHTYQEFEGIKHDLTKLSAQTKDTPFSFAAKNFK
jgi:endo-1,4-beta-xylanase